MADARAAPDRRLRRRLRQARFALIWEATWPLFWPIPALLGAFVAMALLGVPALLPGWLHLALLAVVAVVLVYFLVRLRHIRAPGEAAVLQRLERVSGFAHGPLQLLSNSLATGSDDPVAQSLWDAYRRRLAAVLAQVRLPLPEAVLPRHDPLGLRFAALILLVVALAGGWRDAPDRIARSLDPNMQWLLGAPPTLQVWITPPDYTRTAPVLLQNVAPDQPVTVPAGSKLLAELQGGSGTPRLELAGQSRDFQTLGTGSARLEMPVTAGGDLVIRQGWRRLGQWHLDVQQGEPPTIDFAAPPDSDAQGRIRFDVEAGDDYGVARAWVEITRPQRRNDKPVTVELPIAGHPRHARQASWHDLTSSPWAGLPVTLTPKARDDAGLTGAGPPLTVTLPEREFHHPVARALVALRKRLALDPDDRDDVIEGLEDIYAIPQSWGNDTLVALALSDATARLAYDNSDAATASVMDTMWQTALQLEEGDRPGAERAVDEAAQALEKALADNAPQQEIDRLTEELRAAIDRLLQALVQEAIKNGAELAEVPPNEQTMSQQDIDRMLQQMQDMSRTGSRDAARQTLDQLKQMLDSLRAGRPSTADRQQMEQAKRLSDALQGIAKDQQDLLDETYRRAQEGNQPGKGDQGATDRQEAIRHRLGDAMQSLGDMGADIPDALGEAEQAMRDASKALGQGDLDGAVPAQTRALDKLRQGSQAANKAMAQKLGMGMGMSVAKSPGRPGNGDPLGRPIYNGGNNPNDETVKIPEEADLQKAREVLDELRRRSGDAHRPTAERDYLDRLLKQLY